MPNPPLISCLMVTLPAPERFDRLKESVAGYVGQTYQPRELVVVANGGTPEALAAIKAHIASLGRDDIRILEPPGTLTLGALRNVSKASARGEVVCQWDDDDLYHPERLERQLAALVDSGAEAVCLQHVMQYFRDDRRLYCTNFRDNVETVFPGSLMCWARTEVAYPETGERARLGEDTEVACQLLARGGLRVLADRPHLYIYVCHGNNSWDEAHHRNLASWRGQSQGLLRRREAMLREGLSVFDFGPGGVTVQGSNGPAFTIGETTEATPAPISLSSEPLISCLMVTLPVPERLGLLKQSIADYLDQTYTRRELVMVIDGRVDDPTTPAIRSHVAALGRDDIRIVDAPAGLTLGALRNLSKASARGEVVCQWDDDDLHHPERLERQLAALVQSGGEAVGLQHVMQFFPGERALYCINWLATTETIMPSSLMCRASAPIAYPETGARARLGEDTEVALQLLARGGLHTLADAPHLYVYVFHGHNASGEAHHRDVAVWHSLSQGLLRRREAMLREALSVFDFGSGQVTVQGSNGVAFTIGGDLAASVSALPRSPLPSEPLISCLMVTLPAPERLGFLKQSIAAYLDQTYRRRELVMVIDGRVDDPATPAIRSHLASLGRDDIRMVEAPAGLTLGALRNLSKASALGDVLCIWDDDDLHHPERLERQLSALVQSGGEGVALQKMMQFFPGERRLYCIDWKATTQSAMPASLMCRGAAPIVYPETGERARRGEEREVIGQLQDRGGYHVMREQPHLYIYVSHGQNTYDDEHHRRIAAVFGLSQGQLRPREAMLREGLSAFDFGPGEVTVQGSNGPAFVLGPAARPDG